MAISRRLLGEGEHVLVSTHTHVKALLLPAVWLILLAAVAGYVSTFPTGNAAPLLVFVIWVLAAVVASRLVVKPFLAWLSTTYTLTDRRLITRTGILSRRRHDIPVPRISDVSYEHGLVDRVLGCGTLVISNAGEPGRVRLSDIPQVELVHLRISDLLFSHGTGEHQVSRERHFDDGT